MIRVVGVGMSGFAFPTGIFQLRYCVVDGDSLKPIQLSGNHESPMLSYKELAYMVSVGRIVPIRDLDAFLKGLLYYRGGYFSVGVDHKGFGNLAVYRKAGLCLSESLYRNISKCLGYSLPCVRWEGSVSKSTGILGSSWYEYGSFEKRAFYVGLRSLYSLMSSHGMYDHFWSDFKLCFESFGVCLG